MTRTLFVLLLFLYSTAPVFGQDVRGPEVQFESPDILEYAPGNELSGAESIEEHTDNSPVQAEGPDFETLEKRRKFQDGQQVQNAPGDEEEYYDDGDAGEEEEEGPSIPVLPEVKLQPAGQGGALKVEALDLLLASNAVESGYQSAAELVSLSMKTGAHVRDIYILGPTEDFVRAGLFRLSMYKTAARFRFVDRVPGIFSGVESTPAMAAVTRHGVYLVEGEAHPASFFTERGEFVPPVGGETIK